MAPPSRYVQLSKEEDEALRVLELSAVMNAKVCLRAAVVRLNAAGWSVPRLSQHFGRNQQSLHNDLDRYETSGIQGLVDGKAPGNKPRITPEIQAFLHSKLSEDRVWNSDLLGEAIEEQFGAKLGREAIRVKLLALGYRWKRTRYAPGKQADPEVVAEHQASLETLKRGRWIRS